MPGWSTPGTRYVPPHERIIARKKRKFSKNWFTEKEPTTTTRIWMQTMRFKKKKKVKKLS